MLGTLASFGDGHGHSSAFFSSGHVLAFMTLSFHVDDALELTAGKNRDAVHMSMGGRR